MSEEIKHIQGRDLKIGDTVKVWWTPGRDTITRFEEYTGVYKDKKEWNGVRIVKFAINNTGGMTVFPHEIFELVTRNESI